MMAGLLQDTRIHARIVTITNKNLMLTTHVIGAIGSMITEIGSYGDETITKPVGMKGLIMKVGLMLANRERTWREKPRKEVVNGRGRAPSSELDDRIVPYEQPTSSMVDASTTSAMVADTDETNRSKDLANGGNTKRLESTIVTPSRVLTNEEDNVTIRAKGAPMSLLSLPLACKWKQMDLRMSILLEL